MLDPNCRPSAIASRQAYLDRLDRILRRVDMVKTSTEDLAYLFPGQDAGAAAAELLARGPACVVVTDGAAAVRAFAGGQADPGRRPRRPGRGHRGRRGRVRRRLPHLVDRQRPRPGRAERPGGGPRRDPGGDLRLGGDLHAPWRRTPVGLRAGRARRLAVAAPPSRPARSARWPGPSLVDWAGDFRDPHQLHPGRHARHHPAVVRCPPAAGRAPVLPVQDHRRGPGRPGPHERHLQRHWPTGSNPAGGCRPTG